MDSKYSLKYLGDEELMKGLAMSVARNNQQVAMMLAHLGEVEARKLYLESRDAPCSSMFKYCVDVLNFSEGCTYRRIAAARAARTYPVIFELIAGGSIHLAGLALISPHLTPANHQELLANAHRRSKRVIEAMLASRLPKPDVPSVIRKLPTPPLAPAANHRVTSEPAQPHVEQVHIAPSPALVRPAPQQIVTPLSAERFKVQLTVSREVRDKLRQVEELLRHQIPDGDLEKIFDKMVSEFLDNLLRKRFKLTNSPRPRKTQASDEPGSRHIPNEVQRTDAQRDELQCTFQDATGRRCTERGFLELHHEIAFAKGGPPSVANTRLLCRAHNQYLADKDFGAAFMERMRAGGR